MDRFDPRHTFPIKVEAARHENLNSSQLYNTKSITQTTGHSNASVITGNPFVKEDPDPFEAEIARWIPVCRERLKVCALLLAPDSISDGTHSQYLTVHSLTRNANAL